MAVTVKMLLGAPELAVLDTLQAALDASVESLTAAHPDLERMELFIPAEPTSTAACLADLIVAQAQLLSRLLHNYRTHIVLQPVWAHAAPPEHNLDP